AAERGELARQSEIYWQSIAACEELLEEIDWRPAQAQQLDERAGAKLARLEAELTQPAIRKLAAARKVMHEADRASRLEQAAQAARIVGRPAADFATTDLDGKRHALGDYAGKVLLLDFWHRSCGWCILAMPRLKQLAAELAMNDVVVLGISNDQEEA